MSGLASLLFSSICCCCSPSVSSLRSPSYRPPMCFWSELTQRRSAVLQVIWLQTDKLGSDQLDRQSSHWPSVSWKELSHLCLVWSHREGWDNITGNTNKELNACWNEKKKQNLQRDHFCHFVFERCFNFIDIDHNEGPTVCRWWIVVPCKMLPLFSYYWCGTVSCSPFSMSLPLFRVHLTTHMQVCTVIRFSQSRFVPSSELFLRPSSPAAELFSSLQMEKQTWLPSTFSFGFPLSKAVDVPSVFSTAVICLFLDSHLYFIRYLWISDLSPVCHVLLSITLLPSLSFNPLSFLAVFSCPVLATPFRLRWSSPDTTMVFSLEISPTAFRDDIWR